MSTSKKEKRSLRLLGTGFTMGLADLVPGVSGGTIALLFGIYDELIYSIKLVTGKVIKLLLKGRISEAIRLIPFSFLVPVFAGLLLAIVTMVEVVTYGLDKYPVYVWSLFFGLIIGSAYVVSGRVRIWNPARFALLFLGAVSIFLLVGLPTVTGDSSLLSAGFTGAIAVVAMILPGISGSLIMVILGQYENIIHAVSDRDFATLGVFALGAIVGLALFSRLLSWLLKNYHSAVLAFLIGMMIGSLRKVWPWQEQVSEKLYKNVAPELAWSLVASIVLMLVGIAIVWKLEKSGIAKDHDDIHSKEFQKKKNT